tara:strand:+ start:363 stop:1598 length:1236 start_codon:yes stop_codon:yes gene_type:complete
MSNNKYTLSIIRESRKDDKRTPLTPKQISKLLKKYDNLKILVQPSSTRCFEDKDYYKAGATLCEDISSSDIIFGVKEVEVSHLIENKTYIFFSHLSKIQKDTNQATQGTPGMNKRELLREILKKNITLIDYENIRDNLGIRYLGFGRFAGIVGCYNTLNLNLNLEKKIFLPRAFELKNYEKIKEIINKQNFGKLKILLTGRGRAAKGAIEMLEYANFKQISLKEYLNKNYNNPVFCNISAKQHVERSDNKSYSKEDFILNPSKYRSKVKNYLSKADIFIACHYWNPKFPKLFSLKEIKKFKDLKIIGDITCDVNGSIPTTVRSTTIEKPYYTFDINSFQETSLNKEGIAIMAVDNLPSELPRDSSEEFGKGVLSQVIPFLITGDDGRIKNATIASNRKLCTLYDYLKYFIN